ncbi:MAG TPA: CBS domain-containing protein [Actinomycetes bacterium]
MTATTTQAAAGLERLLGTTGEAMTSGVIALAADLSADVAVRRLERAGVSGAPVVRAGRVVGVATLRDLLTPTALVAPAVTSGPFLRHEHLVAQHRVADLMTAEPVAARADWPLARAVMVMDEAGVNRLPVVDGNGRPAGILTRDDVVRTLARRLRTGLQAEVAGAEPVPAARRPVMLPD